jgi:hypothetical protein
VNSGQFVQWQDLFVVLDNGTIPLTRYPAIEAAMREQARTNPGGIACLVILPADTRPPPDDTKQAVKSLLGRMMRQLSCLAYVVEGTGFRGVAVRATLVGMKIFSSRPYPIYVDTSLQDALVKVVPHLVNGHMASIELLKKTINDARLMWQVPAPERARDNEMTLK